MSRHLPSSSQAAPQTASVVERYLDIPIGEYAQFIRFFRDYPSIKEESQRLLGMAREMASKSNEQELKRCVYHLTILHNVGGTPSQETVEFLRDLQDDRRGARSKFRTQMETVLATVRERARAPQTTSSGLATQQYPVRSSSVVSPAQQPTNITQAIPRSSKHQTESQLPVRSAPSVNTASYPPEASTQRRHLETPARGHQPDRNDQFVDDFDKLAVKEKAGEPQSDSGADDDDTVFDVMVASHRSRKMIAFKALPDTGLTGDPDNVVAEDLVSRLGGAAVNRQERKWIEDFAGYKHSTIGTVKLDLRWKKSRTGTSKEDSEDGVRFNVVGHLPRRYLLIGCSLVKKFNLVDLIKGSTRAQLRCSRMKVIGWEEGLRSSIPAQPKQLQKPPPDPKPQFPDTNEPWDPHAEQALGAQSGLYVTGPQYPTASQYPTTSLQYPSASSKRSDRHGQEASTGLYPGQRVSQRHAPDPPPSRHAPKRPQPGRPPLDEDPDDDHSGLSR